MHMHTAFRSLVLVVSFAFATCTSICALQSKESSVQVCNSKKTALSIVSIKDTAAPEGSIALIDKTSGFEAINMSLEMLVSFAYDIKPNLIVGLEGWPMQKRFVVRAKVDENDIDQIAHCDLRQKGYMLRAVLEERFGIKFHYEDRTVNVLKLLKDNKFPRVDGGLKLRDRSNFADAGSIIRSPGGEIEGKHTSAGALAEQLTDVVGRPVINETQIEDRMDFDLKWTPDLNYNEMLPEEGPKYPSLATSLREQLGLRLQAGKATTKVLCVDRVSPPITD